MDDATYSTSYALNSRLPRDGGIRPLGLLMQLGGGVALCLAIGLLPIALLGGAVVGGSGIVILLIIGAGIARSVVHMGAGGQIASGAMLGLQKGNFYAWFAIGHTVFTVLVILVMAGGVLPAATAVQITVMLMAWPIVVVLALRRPNVQHAHAQAFEGSGLVGSMDRGIEGAGLLMVGFGAVGILIGLLGAYGIVAAAMLRTGLVGFLMLGLMLALLVRSAVHVRAGLAGMAGDLHVFAERVRAYYVACVVSVIVYAVVIVFVGTQAGGAGFIMGLLFGMTLMVWPVILNRYIAPLVADLYSADLSAFDEPDDEDPADVGFGRAADGGISALGYLLMFFGVYGLAGVLSYFVPGIDVVLGLLGSGAPIYLLVAQAVITLWAGVELALMTSRYRTAGLVYGVAGVVITIWANIPMLQNLDELGNLAPQTFVLSVGGIGMALVFPILTVIAVNRTLPRRTAA